MTAENTGSLLSSMPGSTSSHPIAGTTVTAALDNAFTIMMDERVSQFRSIFEEIDKRFVKFNAHICRLEEEKTELQAAFEAEVDQRHYEMGQVNAVLKQLEMLFGNRDERENQRRKAGIDAQMRQIVHRFKHNMIGEMFATWRAQGLHSKRVQNLQRRAINLFRRRCLAGLFGIWASHARAQARQRHSASTESNYKRIKELSEISLPEMIDARVQEVQNDARENYGKLEALETAFEAEVAQRHYEVGQVNEVLLRLEGHAHRVEQIAALNRIRRIDSKIKQAAHLMKHDALGIAFDCWKSHVTVRTRNTIMNTVSSIDLLGRTLDGSVTVLRGEINEKVTMVHEATKLQVEQHIEDIRVNNARLRQQHITAKMRKVVFRLQQDYIARAFMAWKDNVECKKRFDSIMQSVIMRMKNRNMAMVFETWSLHVHAVARERQEATAQANFERIRQLESMMETKIPDLIDAKAQQVQMQTKILIDSMADGRTKAEQAAHRRKIESKLRQTVHRMQQSAMAHTFFMWKDNVEFIQRMLHLKRRAMNMISNHAIACCFGQWAETVLILKHHKTDLMIRDALSKLAQLDSAFEAEVEQRHYEVGQINAVLKHMNNVLDSNSVSMDRRRKHKIESNLRKVAFALMHSSLGTSWAAWLDHYMRSRRIRHVVMKAGLTLKNRSLARAFHPWAAKARCGLKRKIEATIKSNCADIMRIDDEFIEHKQKFKLLANIFKGID